MSVLEAMSVGDVSQPEVPMMLNNPAMERECVSFVTAVDQLYGGAVAERALVLWLEEVDDRFDPGRMWQTTMHAAARLSKDPCMDDYYGRKGVHA